MAADLVDVKGGKVKKKKQNKQKRKTKTKNQGNKLSVTRHMPHGAISYVCSASLTTKILIFQERKNTRGDQTVPKPEHHDGLPFNIKHFFTGLLDIIQIFLCQCK